MKSASDVIDDKTTFHKDKVLKLLKNSYGGKTEV